MAVFRSGMAVAILIDATSSGWCWCRPPWSCSAGATWWLPRWLDRLLPGVGFEGAGEPDLDRELEELTPVSR